MSKSNYNKDDVVEKSSPKKKGRRANGFNSNKKPRNSKYVENKANLEKGDRDNDPNWYFVSPELAQQSAQLSFQNVLGYGSIKNYKIPSIARIDVLASPGVTYDIEIANNGSIYEHPQNSNVLPDIQPGKSGANLMGAKVYTTLSSFTGRTASYAPQDVTMMILAIAAMAEYSEYLRRAFGVALTYNYRNRSLPLGLIAAMGIDPEDFVANISVYRMRFNVAMARINQLPLLENIAYIKKSRDIFQRVYMDDPTNMSQLFFYNPAGYAVLDELGNDQGSVLRWHPLAKSVSGESKAHSMGYLLSHLEEQITALLESSTLNFIYADLLNMANKLNVQTWKFDYLAENYVVMPEYNANALLQFHNLDVIGMPYDFETEEHTHTMVQIAHYGAEDPVYITEGNDVFCDPNKNNICYNPAFRSAFTKTLSIVDMPTDNPSIEDRIEALRWSSCHSGAIINTATSGLSIPSAAIFACIPDHYVARIVLFDNITWTSPAPDDSTGEVGVRYSVSKETLMSGSVRPEDMKFTQFEHAPLILGVVGNSPTFGGISYIDGGLQYFTTVDAEYIKRLLNITYVGLFEFRV